jgi:hypothetical protein
MTAEILIPPQEAYNTARRMRGLEPKHLDAKTWGKFLLSEHSPIRVATYRIVMTVPYWVSVHFCRHKIGVEHFVTSRREDITGEKRSDQDLVNHEMIINAQALITMARKRLCGKASDETKKVMMLIKESVFKIDRPLFRSMNPDCVYRGQCNEMTPCGSKL